MAQSLVNIGGVVRDSTELTFPATGREFRGAWQLNGDVVEIDMATARDIKIEKIYTQALDKISKAEEQAAKKAMKGESTTDEDAEVSKFKAKPKQAAIDAIANATTPEELDALDVDTIYA